MQRTQAYAAARDTDAMHAVIASDRSRRTAIHWRDSSIAVRARLTRDRRVLRSQWRAPLMLQLRSIDAGYGSFQALFDISLEVNAGEAVAVIGPNGAGKTTLMRVISGLIRPMRGSMHMEGTDLAATPAHRIVELGIAHVPENRRLFPRMTVEDNLRMGGFIPAARPKFRERARFRLSTVPPPAANAAPARRHAVGRRAADVRDRPRADVGAAGCCCSTNRPPASRR